MERSPPYFGFVPLPDAFLEPHPAPLDACVAEEAAVEGGRPARWSLLLPEVAEPADVNAAPCAPWRTHHVQRQMCVEVTSGSNQDRVRAEAGLSRGGVRVDLGFSQC